MLCICFLHTALKVFLFFMISESALFHPKFSVAINKELESKIISGVILFFLDHIWEFKYLFVKHSPISGELELHTTPWTSLECLFDDDRRAIEFKEKFQKDVRSLMGITTLAALLEEKCSGEIFILFSSLFLRE